MNLSSRDKEKVTRAFRELSAFWPYVLMPSDDDRDVPGVVLYRDLDGAIRLRQALDEAIKGLTS